MTRPDPVSTLELRPPDLAPEVCGLLCGYRKGSSLRAREAEWELGTLAIGAARTWTDGGRLVGTKESHPSRRCEYLVRGV